jgi:hypothetical protein
MRGVDGLKNGSPLGLEPKGEEIQGRTGFSVTGQNTEETPAAAPKPVEPAKVAEPKATTSADSASKVSSTRSLGNTNQPLPIAKAITVELDSEPVRPW